MTDKRGNDPAFPNTYDAPFRGITYRQYLAAHISGQVIVREPVFSEIFLSVENRTECLQIVADSVWMLTDAILEAENEA